MSDTLKKITGLIIMVISLYLVFGGLYVEYGYYDEISLGAGIVLFCIGFVMYKLLEKKDEA